MIGRLCLARAWRLPAVELVRGVVVSVGIGILTLAVACAVAKGAGG